MIKAMRQCKDFSMILFNGIKTNKISDENKEEILVDWLMLGTKMDQSTSFHICKEDKIWCGMVEVNDTMSIGFVFHDYYIRFVLLPPEPEMGIIPEKDWYDIWLYDIRVQTSIALLIKLIKDKYPHIIGSNKNII